MASEKTESMEGIKIDFKTYTYIPSSFIWKSHTFIYLLESLGGQRHFPPRLSDEYVYKPEKRLVKPFVHDDSFKPSKKYIEPKYTESKKYKKNLKICPLDQIDGGCEEAPMFVTKRHYKIEEL